MTVNSPNRVYLASLRFAQIPRLRSGTSDTLKTLYIKYLKQKIETWRGIMKVGIIFIHRLKVKLNTSQLYETKETNYGR